VIAHLAQLELDMQTWASILWLAASLITLIPVTRWFAQRITRLVLLLTGDSTIAIYVWFCLLFPGTLVHELSHWLFAKLLGVRTLRFSLGPQMRGQGAVQFGAVTFQRSDFLRESLIGVAPLLVGTGLVLAIATSRLHLVPQAPVLAPELLASIRQLPQAQDAWLWLYLLAAISNAMLPSVADRQAWPTLLLFLGLISAALLLTRAASRIPPTAIALSGAVAIPLAFVFTLTILLDLLLGVCLWGVELLVSALTGREVVPIKTNRRS
jgi:hypothetical protein